LVDVRGFGPPRAIAMIIGCILQLEDSEMISKLITDKDFESSVLLQDMVADNSARRVVF
jgi:hypothetical protein